MAEVKNAFIKSKMNKDLDSRLLPRGEYRDGRNIQVSKSEGEDVGALENAAGNLIAKLNDGVDVDFSVLSGHPTGTLKSIGVYANEGASTIFVFLTDQSLPNVTGTGSSAVTVNYSANAHNYIWSFNSVNKSATKLAEGAFLNFSQQYPIYGINLLENLLFWTDNRNQPRKININRGFESYINEDTISVAKYNPYNTINLYYLNDGTPYSSMQDVVTPYLPNGGKGIVNEPGGITGSVITIDNIKGNVPLNSVSVTGQGVPDGTVVTNWNDIDYEVTLSSVVTLADNTLLIFSQNPFYNNPLSVPIESGSSWPGDPLYLAPLFVSFSYRFTFEDGEKSILAPFTQEAFIPKQDGYFLVGDEETVIVSGIVSFMENKVNNVGLYIPLGKNSAGTADLSPSTLRKEVGVIEIEILFKESNSLAVKILDTISYKDFQNKNGNPDTSNEYVYSYQSRKPYKTLPESEIIRVYDKTPVRAFGQEIISNRVVYSNFQDKHSPPESFDYDVVVNEKSAFSQSGLVASQTTSSIEYPQHNVKQNRSYQCGFILSDRYGRQSGTILSKVLPSSKTQDGITFGGSTFYHPYTANPGANNNIDSWSGDSLKISINTPPVNSNTAEAPDALTGDRSGWNGIYNGDSTSSEYNPLGWYSYKVVVKQTELEYYNVYTPGILNGYPDHDANDPVIPSPEDSVAFIPLIGDNINKVPRDLNEISSDQTQFRSDVKLFGRVTPPAVILTATSTDINIPYYPGTNAQTVAAIANQNEMFIDDVGGAGNTGPPYSTIYEEDSNPYLARLAQGNINSNAIGSLQANNYKNIYRILLGVFETNPRVSLLDIYYETSTTGLVKDLNAVAGQDNALDGFDGWIEGNQEESNEQGDLVQLFWPILEEDISSNPIRNSTVELLSVVRLSEPGEDVSSLWVYSKIDKNDPEGNGSYDQHKLEVNESIYHRSLEGSNRFKFTFNVSAQFSPSSGSEAAQEATLPRKFTLFMTIGNTLPFINDTPISPILLQGDRDLSSPIATFTAVNGFVPTPGSSTQFSSTDDLSWTISQQVPAASSTIPPLTINSDGEVYETEGKAFGTYSFSVQVLDSGNGVYERNITTVFGEEEASSKFGSVLTPQIISEGLTSTGFYWSADYSDTTLIGGNNVPVEVQNTGSIGRAPYEEIELSNIGLQSSASESKPFIESGFLDEQENPYTFINVNRKPLSLQPLSTVPDFDSNNTLDKGTAYIKVDFGFEMFPNLGVVNQPNSQLGIGWPTYLQYRPNNQSPWTTAIDVEGQEIKFGGWQKNFNKDDRDIATSVPSSSPFYNTGFLNESSLGHTATYGNSSDIATSYNDFMPPFAPLSTSAVLSKIFVIGMDQGYKETQSKFGEYRLIARYPQSANTAGDLAVVPTPGNSNLWNTMPNNPFRNRGALFTNNNIYTKISYGDFYYPKGTSNSQTSYPYLISSVSSVNVSDASSQSLTEQVWAREWAMGYVTQLYTNPELTEVKLITPGFYCYRPGTITEGQFVVDNGTENSWVGVQDELANNSYDVYNATQRKFVMQLDSNGKKIKGSSEPITATFA